jgi:hypothetical protein
MRTRLACLAAISIIAAGATAAAASAAHSWGNYHWARTVNPFTVPLGDRVTSDWDGRLAKSSSDWSASSVLDSPVVAGIGTGCSAVDGRIQVCNEFYGFNGWLGLAQIWTRGRHIRRALARMNDSYLSSPNYSNTNKQHVMCQEVGHGYGLGHQDESGADLNTCMDYSNALDNPSPNAHDYQQLETIYNSHVDSSSTVGSAVPAGSGRVIHRRDGLHTSYTVRDLGNGFRLHEFISWAVPTG